MHAAPAVSCADSAKEMHTSIQVQRRQSGIPCAMVLRLMPRSPRRRILVCHRHHADQRADRSGRTDFASADLTPATGVRTTRFCRTLSAPFVLHFMNRSRKSPCDSSHMPDAAASTASRANVRDDRDTPLLRARDSSRCTPDLGFGKSEIFFARGLDTISQTPPVGQITVVSRDLIATMSCELH